MRLGRRDLGLVAPGRRADLVLLSSLETLEVEEVYGSGRVVAEAGRLTASLPPADPPGLRDTMKLAPLSAADFRIAAPGQEARLRTVVNPRFTRWGAITVPAREGHAVLPPEATIMAVFHRHGLAEPRPVLGVLEGWGAWRGALATTVAHDSHNLCVFGHAPEDMAAAANALIACGGGMAVAEGGAVRAILPLPVCGLVSDAPAPVVAENFAALRAAADRIAPWEPPYRVFKAVVGASLACNAGPHVTDLGIADGATGELQASALV